MTNAGDAELDGDLVTLGQLQQMLDGVTADTASLVSTAGTTTPGGGGDGDFSEFDTHPDYSHHPRPAHH